MATPSLRIAPWLRSLGVESAASIYALPPSRRVAGGVAAASQGLWVHADLILERAADGGVKNTGVAVDDVLEILASVPAARVEVHLIVIDCSTAWNSAVSAVAEQLNGASILRWTAQSQVMEHLATLLPQAAERWIEVYAPRDNGEPAPDADGVLVMLIEPGSKNAADPAAIAVVAEHSSDGHSTGVDGGVTPEVAKAAVAAGARHIVVGRALWATA